jgi:hypothetical protein
MTSTGVLYESQTARGVCAAGASDEEGQEGDDKDEGDDEDDDDICDEDDSGDDALEAQEQELKERMEELSQKQQQPGTTQQQLEQQKQREQGQAAQEAQKRERNLRSWIVCRSRSERGACSIRAGTGPVPSTEERELVQQQQQPDGATQELAARTSETERAVCVACVVRG